jgi:hypothetical protein
MSCVLWSVRIFEKRTRRSRDSLVVDPDFCSSHIMKGLVETIKDEKKKRRRGKKLNVLGEEDHGPQFFSPTTIKRAQDVQAAKAAEAEAEKARIASNKITSATKKAKNDAEKAEKALQCQVAKDAKDQIDAEKKAEKEAQKLANQRAKCWNYSYRGC